MDLNNLLLFSWRELSRLFLSQVETYKLKVIWVIESHIENFYMFDFKVERKHGELSSYEDVLNYPWNYYHTYLSCQKEATSRMEGNSAATEY